MDHTTTSNTPALYAHQVTTSSRYDVKPILFDMSDPGTGKTRAHLDAFWRRRQAGGGKLLVVATKSILQPAWGNDIDRFFPGMRYAVANATNRDRAFMQDVDVYITNHDAATWLAKHSKYLSHCDSMVIDESTAMKNPSAQRSKAMRKLSTAFQYRGLLSGTPNPNSVLELWHQALLLDGGERLGQSYWKFRSIACDPVQTGPRPEMVEWKDKPGIEATVFDLLSDITIRHRLEDCVSIPPNYVTAIHFDLPKAARAHYDDMARHAMIMVGDKTLSAVNAATVTQKLLQIAAGAMYDGAGGYEILDHGRTDLVMDLIEERQHCLVAFLWKHQRDLLVAAAKKRGYSYAVIDGDVTKDGERTRIVEDYQAGKYRVLFAHPQSAGHGLTLTKGTSTIWTSPTWNAEHYEQFNHRIYRAGQTEKTETVHVCAKDTLDERVYAALHRKVSSMDLLRTLVETI